MTANPNRALIVYRHAIATLCKENGGTLVVSAPPEDLQGEPFSIWYRMREDGRLEFTLQEDDGATAH